MQHNNRVNMQMKRFMFSLKLHKVNKKIIGRKFSAGKIQFKNENNCLCAVIIAAISGMKSGIEPVQNPVPFMCIEVIGSQYTVQKNTK
jgi:hypothetical protein